MTDLRKLHEAATPGPWESRLYMAPHEDEGAAVWAGGAVITYGGYEGLDAACSTPDAALIAATRNALPFLLDVVEKARAEPECLNHEDCALHRTRRALDALDAHLRGE